MSVVLKVRNADIGEQLVIPQKAMTEANGRILRYKIQGDSVVQQKDNFRLQSQDKIVVREGLKAGDKIVVEGTQKTPSEREDHLRPAATARSAGREVRFVMTSYCYVVSGVHFAGT
jgi:multidrug efflux pump subunit AcrA (membrane-fusion protein)